MMFFSNAVCVSFFIIIVAILPSVFIIIIFSFLILLFNIYIYYKSVVGLERGPLNLVRIIEKLLEREVAAPV
jgi:hypothetical protein